MSLRPATAADAGELARLLTAQLVDHALPVPATLAQAIAGIFEDPARGIAFLGLDDGVRPVAVAWVSFTWTLEHGGKSAWLEELYVEPAQRGRGLGEALLGAALAEARARGCVAVDLEVETGHERVESLYARHGFEVRSRRHWFRRL